jgi:hypothetical protein
MPIRLSTSMSDIGCGCRKVLTDADSALDPHGRRRPWQLGPAKHACEAQEQRARTPAVSPFICLLNMRDGQVNWVSGTETHNGADKKTGMRAMTRTNSGTGPFAAAGPTIPVVRAVTRRQYNQMVGRILAVRSTAWQLRRHHLPTSKWSTRSWPSSNGRTVELERS